LVAVTGASGASLGMKLFNSIPEPHRKYLIVTKNSKTVLAEEENIFFNDDISAPPASGSFGIDAMIIAPCSMNTLAKISCGISDNLVTRSADVVIKERKKLIIAPREMPFSYIHLENMLKLSNIGVVIAPPILGYYSGAESLRDMEDFLIGKWLDLLGIENNLYKRWKELTDDKGE
jgi:4-hydroxy-3-polyprenylbenzoate decarboxylase